MKRADYLSVEEWLATEALGAVYGKAERDAHNDADATTRLVERLVAREITNL